MKYVIRMCLVSRLNEEGEEYIDYRGIPVSYSCALFGLVVEQYGVAVLNTLRDGIGLLHNWVLVSTLPCSFPLLVINTQ